jgi:flagellar protein FliS
MRTELADYQKNQVAGMSQRELILLLHNGALKFLDHARDDLAKEDIEGFADRVERTHRIIHHLYTTLNFEAGGEIAERLGSLYSFIISQLYIVNSTRSEKIIVDLKEVITNLKEGWQEIGNEPAVDADAPAATNQEMGMEKALSVQV